MARMHAPSNPDPRDAQERPAEREPEDAGAAQAGDAAAAEAPGRDESSSGASASSRSSMWERLGRNVGKGLRKAKQIGSRIGEEANSTISRSAIEDDLDGRYRVLGRIVAEQLLEWRRPSIAAEDPAVRPVLEKIREGRERLRSAGEAADPAEDDPAVPAADDPEPRDDRDHKP
jgi:hypothetical protein